MPRPTNDLVSGLINKVSEFIGKLINRRKQLNRIDRLSLVIKENNPCYNKAQAEKWARYYVANGTVRRG